jgi:hypothetical protein
MTTKADEPRNTTEQTDRTLLINGLARMDGARDLKPLPKNLQLGNLELIFDDTEKLIRLRIHDARGMARQYSVRDPQETSNVNEGSQFVLERGIMGRRR